MVGSTRNRLALTSLIIGGIGGALLFGGASASADPAPAKHGHSASYGPAAVGTYAPGAAAEYGKTSQSAVPKNSGYYTAGTPSKNGAEGAQASQTTSSFSTYYVGTHYGATGRCGFKICLYWDSNESGAAIGFNGQVANYYGYVFPNNGTGGGSAVKNNAASVEDQGNVEDSTYYNENYSGDEDWLNSQSYGNLYLTWNNEASGGPWF